MPLTANPGRSPPVMPVTGATDKDRINYLLKRLEKVPPEKRTARFRCVIAVAAPDGRVELCSGECYGIITGEPRGETGFGYDPVILFNGTGENNGGIVA